MIFGLFRKNKRPSAVEATLTRIVAAGREPVLYLEMSVPDTLEGRFEAVSAHMILLMRRLRELPPPAEDFAQELVDAYFKWLDYTLRDTGVGDVAVPKRMKTLVSNFYGRVRAYGDALDSQDMEAFAEALARNVTGEGDDAKALAAYLAAAELRLRDQDFDALVADGPAFAAPGRGETS
ncbi:MAG: ubiquinol-cytochrome C chaperone [Salinarimonadaceae bacterium]|nr:MAG: ubiquinol-cytochrome C chaperone [Salinarimonadaceae bacterium]